MKKCMLFLDRFIREPLRRTDDEMRAYLADPRSRGFDYKTVVVLLTTAIVLTMQEYLLQEISFYKTMELFEDIGLGGLAAWWRRQLGTSLTNHFRWQIYWAVGNFVIYFFIPALIILVVFRQPLSDYGLKLRGAFRDGWVYPVMFVIMVPLVLLASRNLHFQETYPYYELGKGEPLWPRFWIWEMAYALQFLGLEFFFRGFVLHGLRHRFGAYAILVMTVPYCMIHFEKPLPETCGAILAGLALGFMSIKTRSIILGAAIHVSVALSMDFSSLWRRGYFT